MRNSVEPAGAMPAMVLGAALGAVAVWSGTVIVTKLTVAAADPIAVGAWRTILAGLIALPLALRTAALPRDAAARRAVAQSALGAYILFPVLFTLGTARTSAAHAGLVMAALALLVLSTAIPGLWTIAVDPSATWLGIGYLAVFSSIIGYALWYWALAKGDIARNGTIQFLQPVLTLGLAVAVLGEALTPWLLLSAAAILVRVRLAQASATAGTQPSSPGDERANGASPQPLQGDEP